MQVGAQNSYLTSLYAQKAKTNANVDTTAFITASNMATSSSASSSSSASPSSASTKQQVSAFEQRTGMLGLDQVGFDLSGLLSADTRAQLNQQQIINSSDSSPRPLTGLEALGKMINEANSASSDTLASMQATSSPLTKDDLAFLKKVSGYNIIMGSDGTMMMIDDNGNIPPDGSDTKELASMIAQMETDRQSKTLTGSITKDYIESLFARAKDAGYTYSDEFQQKVLSQFGGTDQTQTSSLKEDSDTAS